MEITKAQKIKIANYIIDLLEESTGEVIAFSDSHSDEDGGDFTSIHDIESLLNIVGV